MKESKTHRENENRTEHHKEKLGMEIPEGYFAKSKNEILSSVSEYEKPKQLVFGLKPLFAYPVAATIVFLIGITIWQFSSGSETENQLTEVEATEMIDFEEMKDDVLISSLLVEDADMDLFTEAYIMNEVILAAEIREQEMEDFIINTLFIEDSLLDNYLNKRILEEIIL